MSPPLESEVVLGRHVGSPTTPGYCVECTCLLRSQHFPLHLALATSGHLHGCVCEPSTSRTRGCFGDRLSYIVREKSCRHGVVTITIRQLDYNGLYASIAPSYRRLIVRNVAHQLGSMQSHVVNSSWLEVEDGRPGGVISWPLASLSASSRFRWRRKARVSSLPLMP